MRPKRLISLLVAVCMMITMLPLSAVTAFAADTSTVLTAIVDGYKYEYKVNADGATATITDFRGPVDPAKTPAPYDIHIPSELGGYPVTGLGTYSFSGYLDASPYLHNSYQIGRNIRSVDIPQGVTSYNKIVVFIDRSPAECYNSFRVLWIGEALLPQRRFLGGSNHSFFVEMLIS